MAVIAAHSTDAGGFAQNFKYTVCPRVATDVHCRKCCRAVIEATAIVVESAGSVRIMQLNGRR